MIQRVASGCAGAVHPVDKAITGCLIDAQLHHICYRLHHNCYRFHHSCYHFHHTQLLSFPSQLLSFPSQLFFVISITVVMKNRLLTSHVKQYKELPDDRGILGSSRGASSRGFVGSRHATSSSSSSQAEVAEVAHISTKKVSLLLFWKNACRGPDIGSRAAGPPNFHETPSTQIPGVHNSKESTKSLPAVKNAHGSHVLCVSLEFRTRLRP